jgi:hypothetical protein
VSEDDYICLSSGTCVPQFGEEWTSYIVQYAAAELGRSLADAMVQISAAIAKQAAELAAAQLSGRPNTMRREEQEPHLGGRRAFRYPVQS